MHAFEFDPFDDIALGQTAAGAGIRI